MKPRTPLSNDTGEKPARMAAKLCLMGQYTIPCETTALARR